MKYAEPQQLLLQRDLGHSLCPALVKCIQYPFNRWTTHHRLADLAGGGGIVADFEHTLPPACVPIQGMWT